jgi:hypothetical protein
MKNNFMLRKKAKESKVPLYMIAYQIGISEPTLIRWLRFPLPADKEQRISHAIDELSKEDSQ